MKKVKLSSKLSLNKETIATLNNSQMNQIHGGAPATGSTSGCDSTCQTSCPPPPPPTGR